MKYSKRINFSVSKPHDYLPICSGEKKRISSILSRQIISIANRFDGTSSFTIHITAKGNA